MHRSFSWFCHDPAQKKKKQVHITGLDYFFTLGKDQILLCSNFYVQWRELVPEHTLMFSDTIKNVFFQKSVLTL